MGISILHTLESAFVFLDNNDPRQTLPELLQINVGRYALGVIPPKFPLPVLLDNADTASGYLTLELCGHGPCPACIMAWMDQLALDGNIEDWHEVWETPYGFY